jgi:hypothetical protein
MSENTVPVNAVIQLEFKTSQSETLKKTDTAEAFYQSARLNVSIYNTADEALVHLTSFEVASIDPLPQIEDIAKELMSSLHYKCAYSAISPQTIGEISQHALRLLTQEYQYLSRDPIPENKLPRQARVIEQLTR